MIGRGVLLDGPRHLGGGYLEDWQRYHPLRELFAIAARRLSALSP